MQHPDYTVEELMSVLVSREIRDKETVAVGTLSPVPAAGAILAKLTHAPEAELLIWMIREFWPFSEGVKEFFDLAQRGKVDLFFLGGAQVDRYANTNLHVIGDYEKPKVRLPGGAGTGTLYYTVPRVILFTTDHHPKSFVEHVDFVTGAGQSPPEVYRQGKASKCLTPLCVLSYIEEKGEFVLESVHPGITVEKVLENTGFSLEVPDQATETVPPSEEELEVLRSQVKEKIRQAYPHFVKRCIR